MSLSDQQIEKLLKLVVSSQPDDLDCDGCFERIAEFAEQELAAKKIPEAMQVVQRHLNQCPCCQDELNALMEGLRALEE